jgi:hypothetical protein
MDDSQLKLLEERINNAISFIETMKTREKVLIDEKKDIEKRAADLQELIVEKDKKIDDLSENQLFLKDKIEAVLDKLEGLANLETGGSFTEMENETADVEKEEETGDNDIEESGEIIVEENIVDLKNEKITENENLLFESETEESLKENH